MAKEREERKVESLKRGDWKSSAMEKQDLRCAATRGLTDSPSVIPIFSLSLSSRFVCQKQERRREEERERDFVEEREREKQDTRQNKRRLAWIPFGDE